MKLRTLPTALTAILPLITSASLCHAISLAPGQTATPDLLTLLPNDVDVTPGASAGLFVYPGASNPAGNQSAGIFQNTATLQMSSYYHVGYADPNLPLRSITLSGFKGYSVDAGFTTDSAFPGTYFDPTSVSQGADGDVITYNFTGLTTGTDETLLLIRTDATNYAGLEGTLTFVDPSLPGGAYSFDKSGFGPAAGILGAPPVPEPASLATLALATAALTLRLRRRH